MGYPQLNLGYCLAGVLVFLSTPTQAQVMPDQTLEDVLKLQV